MTTAVREINLGTLNRDRQGRYAKVFTLSYETRAKGSGETVKVVRHLPASGVETIGKVLMKASEDVAWNIEVLDNDGNDCTFDFAYFQG
ncbi:hypothetical protein FH608_046340 [Nonomuraea phyllanthi]|uniref:Uncharacterized protein n=1 Tax=Nonomuraea phyllanthi TaxID=2219224 RepID=A0A5C4V6U4_9ACTN|nr:hypothetical protein [Nonomuraea phyllanthi]KAB8186914.1 hypothetical protein FH608_046340 [Nonomuraea phyllanthi]